METSIKIQMTPTWVNIGDNRACYLIEQVNTDKHLNGKTFRKTILIFVRINQYFVSSH